MDQLNQIGQLFEYFATVGVRNIEQGSPSPIHPSLDIILSAITRPLTHHLTILTLFPSPLEKPTDPLLEELPQVPLSPLNPF